MNEFIRKAGGVSDEWSFRDIHGLEASDVEKVLPDKSKVKAFVFLFPKSIQAEDKGSEEPKEIMFIKETFVNACGPIALLHILGNCGDQLQVDPDSPAGKYLTEAKTMSPDERGEALEKNEALMKIQVQVEPKPGRGLGPDFHYVAIVSHGGTLYELDGTKVGPKSHGDTSEESFVQDAAAACKKFIDANPGQHCFSVLALAKVAEA